jgi:hypothetical protein
MKGRLPITRRQVETQTVIEYFFGVEPTGPINLDSLFGLAPEMARILHIGHDVAQFRIGELYMAYWSLEIVEDPCSWN